jgi:hypothetical protein
LLWGMRPLGENPLRAAGQSCKHRNPWTDDSRRLKGGGGSVAAQGRCHGPSRRFDCPQLRLLRGDSIAVQFGKSQLPFFYRLCSLSGAPLDAGKHLLCVDALLRQFVQRLAGGMIGHMIPDARHKTYKTDFIEAGEVPALAGRRSIESGLGCPFQDGWRYHPPRVVMLRRRWFVRRRFRFGDGLCRVGFERGEDDGGCLLDDFQTLSE